MQLSGFKILADHCDIRAQFNPVRHGHQHARLLTKQRALAPISATSGSLTKVLSKTNRLTTRENSTSKVVPAESSKAFTSSTYMNTELATVGAHHNGLDS